MISSENCCQVFPISSKITNVLVAWVGVNSRWGSIISISLFDWGSIRIFVGWGSNQDWGSIRADTVDILYLKHLNNQVEWNGNLQWMHNALLNVSQHPEVVWFWKISWHFQVRWLGSKQNVRRFSDPYPIVCFESTQRTSKHHLTSQNHPTPGFRIEKI